MSKYKVFEKKLISIYEIHILGDIENFLNIRILRNRSKRKLIFILNGYIEKIADRFDIPLVITLPYIFLLSYSDLISFKS